MGDSILEGDRLDCSHSLCGYAQTQHLSLLSCGSLPPTGWRFSFFMQDLFLFSFCSLAAWLGGFIIFCFCLILCSMSVFVFVCVKYVLSLSSKEGWVRGHSGWPSMCSIVVKLMDLDPQGRWFDPCCGQDKICTAVGTLSKALNPTLLQGYVSCLV